MRCDFRRLANVSSHTVKSRTESGKLFQTCGAAAVNERSPNVVLHTVTSSIWRPALHVPEGWASGISTTSILNWANSHIKNNHWAVARMEFFTVYEFHRLRKSFRQHWQVSAMASYEALRHTRQVSTDHPEHVSRWGNQQTTSQEELSSGTVKDKGIEADQRTPGEEESSKRWRKPASHGVH